MISVDSSSDSQHDTSSETQSSSKRISARLQTIKEENERLTPSEQLLIKNLRRHRLIGAGESVEEALRRHTPRVHLNRVSSRTIARLTDDWSFLDNLELTNTISFHYRILGKRSSLDGKENQLLVQWSPSGVMDDGWVDASSVGDNPVKFKVQNMTWKQKLLVRDMLLKKQRQVAAHSRSANRRPQKS